MRLLKRFTAILSSVAVGAGVLFAAAPAPAFAVDNLDAQTAYNTLVNLAFASPELLTPHELAVIAAQAGIAYAYGWLDAASTSTGQNSRTYSGWCEDGSGNLYFGSGYINDTASAIGFRVVDSSRNVIYAEKHLKNQQYLQYCRLVSGTTWGVSGGAGTTSYGISTDSYGGQSNFEGTLSGDPITKPVVVGSAAAMLNARFVNTAQVCGVTLYDGGVNVTGVDYSLSGDYTADMENLQENLKVEYPDVSEQYYIVLYPSDPTEPTGDSCDCTHIINIEPTVNVEVNVEPTVNVDVDVNVENPLPSEWLETIPTETVENPMEELPTVEVENFTDILENPDEIFPESSGFWWKNFELWIKDNSKLWNYFLGLFTIGVVGFILRKLG